MHGAFVRHSTFNERNRAGENLAWGYGSVERAFLGWYNELDLYNFRNPGFSGATGHFTQVVWKGSTGLGCAVTRCNAEGPIYVCHYTPAGNYVGQFEENVLPLLP